MPPIKYVNNLLTNSSFEEGEETLNYTIDGLWIEEGDANIGSNSLRVGWENSMKFEIKEEDDYVLSFYSKTDIQFGVRFELFEVYNGEKLLVDSYYIEQDLDYDFLYRRYELKGHFRANSELVLSVDQSSNTLTYLDDIQLEKGKVANTVNMVNNSSFQDSVNHWTLSGNNMNTGEAVTDFYDLVPINEKEKALKITSNPSNQYIISQLFNIKGKKGDTYNLSFWYKNEGVLDSDLEYRGNIATLQFFSDDDLGSGTINVSLNKHCNEWQMFNEVFVAENDYEDISLNIMSLYEVNNLYVTNVMLVKNLGTCDYEYDEFGNVISIKDFDNDKKIFEYDTSHQVISIDNSNNIYKYEYDNNNIDRIINVISPTGISKKVRYDNYGNLVYSTIQNNLLNQEIYDNENYFLRLAGTEKNIHFDYFHGTAICKNFECSRQSFKLIYESPWYRIESNGYYLACVGDKAKILKNGNDNSLFSINPNKNGSFSIIVKDSNLALTSNETEVLFTSYEENNYQQQFYFESFENKLYIEEKNEYSSDGKYLTKKIDSLGKETNYEVNPTTGLLEKIIFSNNSIIKYEYNEKKQLISTTNALGNVDYYNHENNNLKEIISGNKRFSFDYDGFTNIKNINLNGTLLISNIYNNMNNMLTKSTFGNGAIIEYEYDQFNRKTKIKKQNNTFNYLYNNLGELTEINSNNNKVNYYYDFAGRTTKYLTGDYSLDVIYNNKSLTTSKVYSYNGEKQKIEYEYNNDDNIIKVSASGLELNNYYDSLGRVAVKTINNLLVTEYNYLTNGNKTSLIIGGMKFDNDEYQLKYDQVYNLTHVYKNNQLVNYYEYDVLNELIYEINYTIGNKYFYIYDNQGNLKQVKTYKIKTDTLISVDNYEHNNSNWEDQLTKLNDLNISYDKIGNPILIGDSKLEWINGRELAKYEDGNNSYQYEYNQNGIRTKKILNGVETKYYHDLNKIVIEDRNGQVIRYIRDDNGDLIELQYNNEIYYYQKNYQDDIIGIYDSEYRLLVEYTYDTWGNIISIKDNLGADITDEKHIGLINPFRYRGYYYDSETNLYYLNSRYYSPKFRRYINADSVVLSNDNNLGTNLYLYIENNPVLNSDENGHFSFWDALDIVSFVDSLVNMVKEPTWGNAGSLALDTIGLLPVLPSVGVAAKGITKISTKTTKTTKVITKSVNMLDDSASAYQKGKLGEDIVSEITGYKKNTTPIRMGDRDRIPDFFSEKDKVLIEVKNVKRQSYTKQLRDYKKFVDNNEGYTMILYVRDKNSISKALRESGIQIEQLP